MQFTCELERIASLKTKGTAHLAFDKSICDPLNEFGDKPVITKITDTQTGECVEIKSEIDEVISLKTKGKAKISFERHYCKGLHAFNDRPVLVTVLVDEAEQLKRLQRISGDQIRKIHAIIGDVARAIGDTPANQKLEMKREFCYVKQCEMFSTAEISREFASEFIEWLIEFAFEHGIELHDKPVEYFDDIERYHAMCLKKKICSVCGRPGEVHHLEGSRIGMGRNRNTIDDSKAKKICLCRIHHSELHQVPESEFLERYHLGAGAA